MSKVVMSLPKGLAGNIAAGAAIALGSYGGMQFLWALLIDRGVLGMERLYPMVCVSAALASFLGCAYSVLRGREGAMLSVPAVAAVFMTLTLAAALLTAEAISIENGVTGLGLSMAAGGLLAALLGGNLPRKNRRGRARSRARRSVKGAK